MNERPFGDAAIVTGWSGRQIQNVVIPGDWGTQAGKYRRFRAPSVLWASN